jgi:hypothetical protein
MARCKNPKRRVQNMGEDQMSVYNNRIISDALEFGAIPSVSLKEFYDDDNWTYMDMNLHDGERYIVWVKKL